jgi:uncharacterized membrane protein
VAALRAVSLILVGLLAGAELVVRWGVQPALSALPDGPHVLARQALVRRLRILVPAIMVPAVLVTLARAIVDGGAWPWAALGCLGVFVLTVAVGTVPLNIQVDAWDPAAPPADWKAVVTRWERIDVLRSTAAVAALVCAAL